MANMIIIDAIIWSISGILFQQAKYDLNLLMPHISISAPINACQANDHACLIPTINDGVGAGIITNLNNDNPFAPIFSAARR